MVEPVVGLLLLLGRLGGLVLFGLVMKWPFKRRPKTQTRQHGKARHTQNYFLHVYLLLGNMGSTTPSIADAPNVAKVTVYGAIQQPFNIHLAKAVAFVRRVRRGSEMDQGRPRFKSCKCRVCPLTMRASRGKCRSARDRKRG